MNMVEKVARAIDAVQCFVRFNNWTEDRVRGLPVEICRYGDDGEEEIVVIRRFSAEADQTNALDMVISEMRARAAIEAMREPTKEMEKAGWEVEELQTPERVWRAMIDTTIMEEAK